MVIEFGTKINYILLNGSVKGLPKDKSSNIIMTLFVLKKLNRKVCKRICFNVLFHGIVGTEVTGVSESHRWTTVPVKKILL